MKKTKLMRAALLLLVLTLITSCFVGGTFAKYVTDDKSTDSARVAKWGVKITATGTTFANTYKTDDTRVTTIANSVVGFNNAKVVAPGTKGDMAKMTLEGTPEVAVRVSYAAGFDIENWTVTANDATSFYCPLVIKVSTKSEDGSIVNTVIMGRDFDNEVEFENAVNAAIAAYSDVYEAGTNLSAAEVKNKSLSVSWEWPFEKTPDPDPDTAAKYKQTDENDTALGNVGTATISLTVKTTVTQID